MPEIFDSKALVDWRNNNTNTVLFFSSNYDPYPIVHALLIQPPKIRVSKADGIRGFNGSSI
jgi:hypothetical protein